MIRSALPPSSRRAPTRLAWLSVAAATFALAIGASGCTFGYGCGSGSTTQASASTAPLR